MTDARTSAREDLDEELLVDFLEAVQADAAPSPDATGEVAVLLELLRPCLYRSLARRRVLRRFDELRGSDPLRSIRDVARQVGDELGVPAETARSWWLAAREFSTTPCARFTP